jgi:hypothetical protein
VLKLDAASDSILSSLWKKLNEMASERSAPALYIAIESATMPVTRASKLKAKAEAEVMRWCAWLERRAQTAENEVVALKAAAAAAGRRAQTAENEVVALKAALAAGDAEWAAETAKWNAWAEAAVEQWAAERAVMKGMRELLRAAWAREEAEAVPVAEAVPWAPLPVAEAVPVAQRRVLKVRKLRRARSEEESKYDSEEESKSQD